MNLLALANNPLLLRRLVEHNNPEVMDLLRNPSHLSAFLRQARDLLNTRDYNNLTATLMSAKGMPSVARGPGGAQAVQDVTRTSREALQRMIERQVTGGSVATRVVFRDPRADAALRQTLYKLQAVYAQGGLSRQDVKKIARQLSEQVMSFRTGNVAGSSFPRTLPPENLYGGVNSPAPLTLSQRGPQPLRSQPPTGQEGVNNNVAANTHVVRQARLREVRRSLRLRNVGVYQTPGPGVSHGLVPPPPPNASFEERQNWYRTVYLSSEHWKLKRQEVLKGRPRCAVCQCTSNLDVHHMTYRNIGRENVSDFAVLCRTDHARVEKYLRDRGLGPEYTQRVIASGFDLPEDEVEGKRVTFGRYKHGDYYRVGGRVRKLRFGERFHEDEALNQKLMDARRVSTLGDLPASYLSGVEEFALQNPETNLARAFFRLMQRPRIQKMMEDYHNYSPSEMYSPADTDPYRQEYHFAQASSKIRPRRKVKDMWMEGKGVEIPGEPWHRTPARVQVTNYGAYPTPDYESRRVPYGTLGGAYQGSYAREERVTPYRLRKLQQRARKRIEDAGLPLDETVFRQQMLKDWVDVLGGMPGRDFKMYEMRKGVRYRLQRPKEELKLFGALRLIESVQGSLKFKYGGAKGRMEQIAQALFEQGRYEEMRAFRRGFIMKTMQLIEKHGKEHVEAHTLGEMAPLILRDQGAMRAREQEVLSSRADVDPGMLRYDPKTGEYSVAPEFQDEVTRRMDDFDEDRSRRRYEDVSVASYKGMHKRKMEELEREGEDQSDLNLLERLHATQSREELDRLLEEEPDIVKRAKYDQGLNWMLNQKVSLFNVPQA